MHKQMMLQLTQDATLRAMWDLLPQQSQERMLNLYANLIAHAVREPVRPTNTEKDHEADNR